MRIIVCIKQVPDTMEVQIDPETGTLQREGIEAVVNPLDMYAIEEGIRLKEKHGGTVIALSMGPPQAENALREALALGCDEAILLSDRAFAGADTWATSYTLARAIKKIGDYDLIVCGLKTTDGDTAQVGPGLAEELGIPHVSYVGKIVDVTGATATLNRPIEESYEVVEAPLPCLITVTKEINVPRLPSFRRKMQARKMEVVVWGVSDLTGEKSRFGLEGSATRVIKVFPPPPRPGGEMLSGDATSQAETLIRKLRERHML
ncbi:MAG: electron transfer flavoprotein subunit beta/FixA family protein [Candidatus Bathyarchaeota archaeon]|nr:electron transfer flavoprotein subunit beta/FixA family protein [Candidatus Bathyarchaeota archaeon]